MTNYYYSENGNKIFFDYSETEEIISLDEIRVHPYYNDMADLAEIFNHDIVKTDNKYRWKHNRLICWIKDFAPVYTPSNSSCVADDISVYGIKRKKRRASIDFNSIVNDMLNGMFTVEELVKLYMQIGYDFCGFCEIFNRKATDFGIKDTKIGENIVDYMRRVHKGQVLKL